MTTNKPEVVMTLLGGEQLVRLSDYEALQAECEKLRKETIRLDFMLAKHRKVVIEVLPRGQYEIYVEEGFMGEKAYTAIPFTGDFDGANALQREAIDAAMQGAQP